jgi:hypothetical protein
MDKKIQTGEGFKVVTLVLIAFGVFAIIAGFLTGEGTRIWANLLLNNYYFLSVTIGATFWMALQAITQSGWSSAYLRIPQAMSNYLIVSFVLWLFMFAGLHDLYHWTHHDAVMHDPILLHKEPYLNVPFFTVRFALFFGLWIFLTQRIKKLSAEEDKHGGLTYFNKIEFTSKVYIFVLAVSFSLFTIDWLMSLDAHWYSTIYAVKKFVMSFYHGVTWIAAIAIILYKMGLLPVLTKAHLQDFGRYIFALSIIWGYMWLSQYLLIWYANIPEETIYYVPRIMSDYKNYFYAELIVNWLFPFLFLMWNRVNASMNAMLFVVLVLIAGQWIELYMSIMPNTIESHSITYIEVGTFLGFAALFVSVIMWSLNRIELIPKNHPYYIESIKHH